ncbi:S26 family signal peptidase [Kibdelosporangium aridum]|uniref:Signal peptidase I n=1 Tax=Kibdelosporangium aridum TaxID=2030 RepID=A0A1Y5Y7W9_KIBAR|nr:S26 family signal peptidase [Kibdelosporangium aridum]SMD26903.1 signal peptidase I [Kibdelosporangium aridum]
MTRSGRTYGAWLRTRLARRWVSVTVEGDSMRPTFNPGDRVLARRVKTTPQAGDIVVVEAPVLLGNRSTWHLPPPGPGDLDRRWLIKRVAAVGGDLVPAAAAGVLAAGEVVPPGSLLVVGDNPAHSHDSRHLGPIPVDRVIGRVVPSRRIRSDFS